MNIEATQANLLVECVQLNCANRNASMPIRCQYNGGPVVNKFEQVSSDARQMLLVGK